MASGQQTVEELFSAALELPPEQRHAFLDRACRGAAGLRSAVEELLAEDKRAGSFLATPLFGRGAGSSQAETSTQSCDRPSFPFLAPASFEPAQVIAGRFVVVRFIARGGMGEVYEVEDRLLQGARVALKVIRPEIAMEAGVSHRFEQEVLLARKVNHPNLCPIYEIFRCDQPAPPFLFLTMKLLDGETLDSRLQLSHFLPPQDALDICTQMIAGVAAIHAAGVIHRDLKPKNVMLEHSGPRLSVSIMDFGLARLHGSESTRVSKGMVAGTPGYIAPEVYLGHRPSQATDLFALGVVLHQVLTGQLPTEARRGHAVFPAVSLSSAQAPLQLIQAVRDFLSEDPVRRCDAFERVRSSLETQALTHQPQVSPRLWTRRTFAFAGGASLCTLVGGLAWQRNGIYDMLHPLPSKRFVAVLDWPPLKDARVKPMVMGLIDAVANELARAEAFDRNFFVIARQVASDVATPTELNEIRESLGANLVLATSGFTTAHDLRVTLDLLDPASEKTLRSKELRVAKSEQISLPERVVRAAAQLLDVSHYEPDDRRSRVATDNGEALQAFQAAEALMKQPNNAGLEQAIEKYKTAVEADRRFAAAHARLAIAYTHLYSWRRDPSSLVLARANADTALSLNPNLVESHLALGSVYWTMGALTDALHQMILALALDPSDTRVMTYQAQLYNEQNHWKEAEEAFKRVLRVRPNYWLAYNELGNNYNEQGNYVDALAAYRAAAVAAPGWAMTFNNIASMYFQLGSFPEALAAVDRAIALAPTSAFYQTRSDILRVQGKYADALKAALQATRLNPEDGTAWLELGDAYATMPRRVKEAAAAYRKAASIQEKQLQVEPGNGPGWMLLALYRVKSEMPEGSLALIKKAESLGAGDIYSQLFKVRTLEQLGRRDEALAALLPAMRKGVTIYQVRATRDLDRLRADPRFPGHDHNEVVPPKEQT